MSGFLRNSVVLSCMAALATGLAASTASAQSMANCYATIKSPIQGTGVGNTATVQGYSNANGNVAVWVLTRRKGISDWWPQGGGPVSGNGEWAAQVTLGTAREVGQPFEIAVIPVDLRTNEGLAGWNARATEYAEYPGIPLPRPAAGCRYNVVQVQRVQ
jgi:hypothetical protein